MGKNKIVSSTKAPKASPTKGPKQEPDEVPTLQSKLKNLQDEITELYMSKNLNLQSAKFMEFYNHAYEICVCGYDGSQEYVDEIYKYVLELFTNVVKNKRTELNGLTGVNLLERYNDIWNRYHHVSNVVARILSYLDAHFLKRQIEESVPGVKHIYSLCMYQWQIELFAHVERPLMKAVYEQILNERNGERIVTSLITAALGSLRQMGINDPKLPKIPQPGRSTYVYEQSFERRFLKWTLEYYIFEAKEFLHQNTIFEYMKKVEQRIDEERDRVTRYLDISSLPKIENTIDNAMIIEYLDRFRAEFDNMLTHNQIENLGRMHLLCSRVQGALDALHEKFKVHVTERGQQTIAALASDLVDPRVYVNTILDEYKHFDNVVKVAFRNDTVFRQFFDKAVTEIVNDNAITKKANNSAKTSEFLSRYCDFLLRKSSKALPEAELENAMEEVMIFFRYITDKDVFQMLYSKLFAKRICNDVSASDDLEAHMLSKLKHMCGFEYVSKLQRMYQDNAVSKELTMEFKNFVKTTSLNMNGIDLSVLIVAQGVWPQSVKSNMMVPNVMDVPLSNFQLFYHNKFNSRKLDWLHCISRGDVVCNAFSRKYTFTVNTPQLAVLTLYNEADSYTLQQILDNVKFQKEELPAILTAMIKLNLLKLENGVSYGPDTPLDTKVELNMKFTSKKMKMDVSRAVPRADTKKEEDQVAKDLEDDRIMVIQAAIVRVMKMRKKLAHTQLIAEVIKQLSNRFTPNLKMIKKCVELLIEKEYLARCDDDRQMYEYLS
uniref:CULLIN_2 domain-containing protein n=1 Tax=Panagrellus redivivus TaxID=6233 RepID=A0A7E4VJ31_PANRE